MLPVDPELASPLSRQRRTAAGTVAGRRGCSRKRSPECRENAGLHNPGACSLFCFNSAHSASHSYPPYCSRFASPAALPLATPRILCICGWHRVSCGFHLHPLLSCAFAVGRISRRSGCSRYRLESAREGEITPCHVRPTLAPCWISLGSGSVQMNYEHHEQTPYWMFGKFLQGTTAL